MSVKSPCINLCKYVNGKCIGCYRTLDEIEKWSKMSDDEKREVLNKITVRRLKDGQDYYG